MIDTRNSYRAVPVKDEPDYWRVQYRRWFWLVWVTIAYRSDLDCARETAIEHATPDLRETVHFGRLPA